MNLKIVEIFKSIQGESSFAGFPFLFIRLAGCNLRCSYCDTKYAQEENNFPEIEIEKILNKIESYKIRRVLVTGGEPLLQNNVYNLIEQILNMKKEVFIETNGSILLDKVDYSVVKIVDFKTPSSGMCQKNNFKNIHYLTENDEVKFVIGCEEDFKWSIDVVKKYKLEQQVRNIHFSPVWNKLNAKILGEWILSTNVDVRLTIQLHKILNMK